MFVAENTLRLPGSRKIDAAGVTSGAQVIRLTGMTTIVLVFVILGALATGAVLVRGIIVMARGKDVTGRQSNRLMSYRVGLQLVTVIFVVILILLVRAGQ